MGPGLAPLSLRSYPQLTLSKAKMQLAPPSATSVPRTGGRAHRATAPCVPAPKPCTLQPSARPLPAVVSVTHLEQPSICSRPSALPAHCTSLPTAAHLPVPVQHKQAPHRRRAWVCRATQSTAPFTLPDSPQKAISDAVQCASVRLKPRMSQGRAPSKGFAASAASTARENVHIDIPTADESPAAIAQLALDTLQGLTNTLGGSCTPLLVVCCSDAVVSAVSSSRAKPSGVRVMELREACRQPRLEGSLLLVVAPRTSDVALCQQLTDETWEGKGTLLLNAQFLSQDRNTLGLTNELNQYVDKVNTVYALMPVAVKGLLGNMEGVVLRRATGKSADDVWRILMRAPGKAEQYLQIGQTKRRPDGDELQVAFINANAANSPVNKVVAKLKGTDKKK